MGKTHGMRKSLEYASWAAMKTRVFNKNVASYKDYGGRGITICPEWVNSFPAFLAAVGPRPTPKHTLERKDTNGNYEPGNVRWATRTEQMRNMRRNRVVTIGDQRMPVSEAAEVLGMPGTTLLSRVKTWPKERDLSEKKWKLTFRKVMLTFQGETLSLNEWSARTGIKVATLRRRVARGWRPELILLPQGINKRPLKMSRPLNPSSPP